MRSWLFPPPVRSREATPAQVAVTGAAGGWGADPLDGDVGWRPAGAPGRPVPWWTQEKARIYSVAAYRINPMARAIVDTYTAFCVGDSGVSPQVTNPEVAVVVDEFWSDPRNQLGALQDRMLRDHMLLGETTLELVQGPLSGVVRFSPIDPARISDVRLLGGNPLWPHELVFGQGTAATALRVAAVDDLTGLRDGRVAFWRSWMALLSDVRGDPFLSPILDHLDSYDQVISNLIDRTALARYMVWDVTVEGDQPDVDKYVKARGGTHIPPSGSVEVHNEKVKWEAKYAQSGAEEDSTASKSVLTLVAGGAGLAKTWLAEPDGANRATSLTMAEPVRRRVGGVQKLWLSYQTELCRFAVDRAVAARRLPRTVTARDPQTGREFEVPAAQSVTVTGPSISASDAEFTARVLLNLATGLEKMVKAKILTPEAAQIAGRKAWEDYVGVPYTAELNSPDANPDDVAAAVEEAVGRGFDPSRHPRAPGGSPIGGRFIRRGVGGQGSGFTASDVLATSKSGDMDAVKRQMASVMDGEYAGLTVRTRLVGVEPLETEFGVIAMGDILDGTGQTVGSVAEVIQQGAAGPYVTHGDLSLRPEVQGQGFAREFIGHVERWYREAGVTHVELFADIDVGGYAWARQGFDFKTSGDARKILRLLQLQTDRLGWNSLGIPSERIADQVAAARALLDRAERTEFGSPDYPSAYEISQLGRWPGAGRTDRWIGKATLLGSGWNGVKPL